MPSLSFGLSSFLNCPMIASAEAFPAFADPLLITLKIACEADKFTGARQGGFPIVVITAGNGILSKKESLNGD
jgi:hypothetical protein